MPQGQCPVQGNNYNSNLFSEPVPLPSPSSGWRQAEALGRKGEQGVVWPGPPAETWPAPASLSFCNP